MQFSTVLLSAVSVLGLSVSGAFAADCAGANWGKPDMALYWTAREVACNSGNSQYSDARVSISYTGNKPSTQLCWDATENILNQCIKSGRQIGYYNYAGSSIRVERH